MKLHTLSLQFAMAQAHDDAVARFRRNFQTIRQRLALDNQRMIASSLERRRKLTEDRLAVVTNLRRLAMHPFGRAHHAPAKHLPNRLVSQTHAENWQAFREVAYQVWRDAGILRPSGPG